MFNSGLVCIDEKFFYNILSQVNDMSYFIKGFRFDLQLQLNNFELRLQKLTHELETIKVMMLEEKEKYEDQQIC